MTELAQPAVQTVEPELARRRRIAIVPAFNEEHTVARVIDEIRGFDNARFHRLDRISSAWLQHKNDDVGAFKNVYFCLPDTDRLDDDSVHAEAFNDVGYIGCCG